jgi:hypothetical protein
MAPSFITTTTIFPMLVLRWSWSKSLPLQTVSTENHERPMLKIFYIADVREGTTRQ